MQTALKSGANFSSSDLKALTAEATRLEVAGIKSSRNTKIFPVNNCESLIDANETYAMIDKVTEKFKNTSFNTAVSQIAEKSTSGPSRGDNVGEASFVNYYPRGSFRQNNNRGFRRGYRGRRGDFRKPFHDVSQRKCRSCKSTEHLIRNCPTIFCHACGQRDHDQSSNTCPNFQQWLDCPRSTIRNTKGAVTLTVEMHNKRTNVILQSSAGCSVIDLGSLEHMGLADSMETTDNTGQ